MAFKFEEYTFSRYIFSKLEDEKSQRRLKKTVLGNAA